MAEIVDGGIQRMEQRAQEQKETVGMFTVGMIFFISILIFFIALILIFVLSFLKPAFGQLQGVL